VLTVRDRQRRVFEDLARERFVAETLRSLPEVFPGDARVGDPVAMRALIEDGIERAVRLGIEGGREVMLYVFLLHELGPSFEDAAGTRWIGDILRDPELAPSTRLDLIYARLELAARAQGAA